MDCARVKVRNIHAGSARVGIWVRADGVFRWQMTPVVRRSGDSAVLLHSSRSALTQTPSRNSLISGARALP